MSKTLLILCIASALAGGCASTPEAARSAPVEPRSYDPATASALAFDPPVALGQPLPSFSRDGRAMEAFAGYEEQITTYSYTHQRDEIRVHNDYGTLDRRAYTDRTSITTR